MTEFYSEECYFLEMFTSFRVTSENYAGIEKYMYTTGVYWYYGTFFKLGRSNAKWKFFELIFGGFSKQFTIGLKYSQ